MLNNRKGQALIVVLTMTAVTLLLGIAALSLGSIARKNAVLEVRQARAFYTAEAGVEMALAEAKCNYAWLKTAIPYKPAGFTPANDEKCLLADNYHYPEPEDERVIESVRVVKTAEDTKNNIVDLRVQATGRSGQSRKTVTVDAKLFYAYPELLFRGLWTGDLLIQPGDGGADSPFSAVVAAEGVTIPGGTGLTGNIYCSGNVSLQDGSEGRGVVMSGDIISAGNVYLGDNARLTGRIYIDGNHTVTCGGNAVLNGQVTVLSPAGLGARMPPPVPALLTADSLNWYLNNAAYYSLPAKIAGVYSFHEGVYYIEPAGGVLALEGKYTGRATLVVNGGVHFSGDFTRQNSATPPVDCLAVLAAGPVQTGSAAKNIDCFIFSKDSFGVNSETDVTGSIVAARIDPAGGGAVRLRLDSSMLKAYQDHLTATTNFIRIANWVD